MSDSPAVPSPGDDSDESVLPELNDDGDDEALSLCQGSIDGEDDASTNNRDDAAEELDLTLLPSWTPSTTHLLLCPSLSSANDTSCPYFDILDHVLRGSCCGSSPSSSSERYTPAQILGEVQALQDEGIISNLKPARTAMEVQSDALSSLLSSFGSASSNANEITMVRGDRSAFIPRALHRPSLNAKYDTTFAQRCPALCHLITAIEHTVQSQLVHVLDIDTVLTSVQVAMYPGDGTSGYPRHCDRGNRCASEPYPADTNDGNGTSAKTKKRIITAVYYLTPDDWDAEADGGALRIYRPGPSDATGVEEQYCDAIPYSDRLVVFRSDLIEHEVLPSLRRERTAITVWIYGDIKSGVVVQHADPMPLRDSGIRNGSHQPPRTVRDPPPPLPINKSCSPNDAEDRPRIFVTIPAYRDPETNRTICSLYETATYPERIYVGVVWQIDTSPANADAACLDVPLPNDAWSTTNVRRLTLDYRHATGPCLARAMAQTLHRGEEYILQIDSHMRFRENWDEYLLEQISKCPNPHESVLTAYPPAYVLDANGEAECVNNETRSTILVPWKFSDGMLRQKGRLLNKTSDVIPCPLYAAGFNFSSASVIKDCPYNGTLHHLFFGEEMSMAVRLYTHGYDFFAPTQSVCYHKWTRDHRPTIQEDTKVTSAPGEGSGQNKSELTVQEQRKKSIDVVKSQLQGMGPGLGTVRSADDFASHVGVCFRNETITPGAENVGLSPVIFAPSIGVDDSDGAPVDKKEIISLVSSFLNNL